MRTFKTQEQAAKALALALGMKGAAGGWIYRPRIEHLTVQGRHSGAGGSVPSEWRGRHVVQSWATFAVQYGGHLAQDEQGRWYVREADVLYARAKAESSKVYAEYLDALAYGSPEKQALLKAQHEGWKVRVFAAYNLAHGGRKVRQAA